MEELTAQEVDEAFEGIVFPENENCFTSVRFASTSQSEIQQHSEIQLNRDWWKREFPEKLPSVELDIFLRLMSST